MAQNLHFHALNTNSILLVCNFYFSFDKFKIVEVKAIIFIFSLIVLSNQGLAQCKGLSSKQVPEGVVRQTTGNRLLDSVINVEFIKLENFFHLNLEFYYLEESHGENAFYDPSDASVLLGRKLMSHCDYYSIIAVLAHEFGHAMQHVLSWKESGKRPELHSDYLAGYYIGKQYATLKEPDLNKLIEKFYSLGGDDFFSPDHHGKPEERMCAFFEGYYFAKTTNTTVEEACLYGFLYVEKDTPCLVQKYNQYNQDISNGQVGSVGFKTTDKKTYVISYKDVDGQVRQYRINRSNPKCLLSQMSSNFKYTFNIYEETTLSGLIFVNTLNIQPGRNLIMEITLDDWKINGRQFRIISDYKEVKSNSKYAFKFTSLDNDYYIFDAQDKYIGKTSKGLDLFISTMNYDFNYFNIYRFQGGKMIFEEEFSKDMFMIPVNGNSNIQMSKKSGLKQSFVYP